ncbi:MAG: hypothetical protein ACOX6L_11960 [Syntrophomonadaceae bacterium]
MERLRMKVRFDYRGRAQQGKLFGGKTGEQVAEEIRQNKISLIRNVPIQGIYIEDIDMGLETYSVVDEITGKLISYAPVIITLNADTIEEVLKFTMKDEFRTIEIINPEEITLSKIDLERLLLKISEELGNYRTYLERKIDNWR